MPRQSNILIFTIVIFVVSITAFILGIVAVANLKQVNALATSQSVLASLVTSQDIPIIKLFSGEVGVGSVENLLVYNNPNCTLMWNSAMEGGSGGPPVWVMFDFLKPVTMTLFQFANYGDITHDVTSSQIFSSLTPKGPSTQSDVLVSISNTPDLQSFNISNLNGRYFKWYITATEGGWQPYVRCVNFTVI